MAEVIVRSRSVLSAGDYIFGPVQLASPASEAGVAFDRFNGAQWPTGVVLSMSLEWSADGIGGWQELCASRDSSVSQSNLLPISMSFSRGVPLPAGSFVRAKLTAHQPFDCQVRLTWQ